MAMTLQAMKKSTKKMQRENENHNSNIYKDLS